MGYNIWHANLAHPITSMATYLGLRSSYQYCKVSLAEWYSQKWEQRKCSHRDWKLLDRDLDLDSEGISSVS